MIHPSSLFFATQCRKKVVCPGLNIDACDHFVWACLVTHFEVEWRHMALDGRTPLKLVHLYFGLHLFLAKKSGFIARNNGDRKSERKIRVLCNTESVTAENADNTCRKGTSSLRLTTSGCLPYHRDI